MIARALYLFLAGALGGLIAYAVMEPSAPADFFDPGWKRWQAVFSVVFGACVAATLGVVYGASTAGRRAATVGLLAGALVGAVGGSLGLTVGGSLSVALFGDVLGRVNPGLAAIPARIVVFVPFGALVGLVFGIPSRSWIRARNGLIGGAIGGALGGATFDLIGQITGSAISAATGGNEVGSVSRAVTCVAIGGGIGLCVGLVELATRQAWVRVILGRNEGKEYLIDTPQTYLGRSERAHVPLYGDDQVMPMHAMIVCQSRAYFLVDGGSPIGTGLNGQRITQAPLTSGDYIQIGRHQLQFLTRSGRMQRIAAPEALRGAPPMPHSSAGVGFPTAMSPAGAVAAGPVGPAAQTMTAAIPLSRPHALVAVAGPLTGTRFEVSGSLEVGREATGISLSFDSTASRRHARVVVTAGGLAIQDLGSTNGTLVNGVKVTQQELRPGDLVQVGVSVFRVE